MQGILYGNRANLSSQAPSNFHVGPRDTRLIFLYFSHEAAGTLNPSSVAVFGEPLVAT
jgi:hypothetical protein